MRRAALFLWLLLAIAARPAGAACEFLKVASLHPMVDSNRLFLPGAANGQDILFLTDTGAQHSLIPWDTAQTLGLDVVTAPGQVVGVSGKPIQLYRARIKALRLGNWVWQDVDLLVSAPETGSEPAKRKRPAILLGADFLSKFDIELNLSAGEVNLFTPKDCGDAKLSYWAERDNQAAMSSSYNDTNHILLRPKVNGTELTALLDTGATFTSLSTMAALQVAGLRPDSPGVTESDQVKGIGGKELPSWLATFDSFSLDAETIKPAKLRFLQFGREEVHTRGFDTQSSFTEQLDMILGLDFVYAHHILIANSQRKVYFTYSGGAPFQKVWSRAPEPASGQ